MTERGLKSMKAKDYLSQIEKFDKLIENKMQEAERWRQIATGTTMQAESERVQASGSKQRMEDAICRCMNAEAEVNEAIDKLVDLKQKIITDIEKLSLNEYDVLHKKYVQFKELYEIAVEIDKSYSWVKAVHGSGLYNLQKILDSRSELT